MLKRFVIVTSFRLHISKAEQIPGNIFVDILKVKKSSRRRLWGGYKCIWSQKSVPQEPFGWMKSADPRSGVSEHLDLGRSTSPLPPSALGVATGQHQNPRRVLLKGRKSLGGSRLKVKNPATLCFGEKVDENMIFGGRRPNVS